MKNLEDIFSICSNYVSGNVYLQVIYNKTGEVLHETRTKTDNFQEAKKIIENYREFMFKSRENSIKGIEAIMLWELVKNFNIQYKGKSVNQIIDEVVTVTNIQENYC